MVQPFNWNEGLLVILLGEGRGYPLAQRRIKLLLALRFEPSLAKTLSFLRGNQIWKLLYTNFRSNRSNFRKYIRHIRSAIFNFTNLTSDPWSMIQKTQTYMHMFISGVFEYFLKQFRNDKNRLKLTRKIWKSPESLQLSLIIVEYQLSLIFLFKSTNHW